MKKIVTLFTLLMVVYSSYAQIAPFITTQWNQDCYYNASCPAIAGGPCGNAYTGCNATATGQIMKYYAFPSSGMGSHCDTTAGYTSNCVNFPTATYNYAAMPNTLTSANSNVANLLYDLGVALDMNWGATGSSSYNSSTAYVLKTNFKYSPKMYYNFYSSFMSDTMALINKIKAELNAGRPLIIDSDNHAYLVDGYNSANQFHCNFGWGGQYDGYYNITSVVNAGDPDLTPDFINFNIMPMQGELEFNAGYGFDQAATDTITFLYNGGSFGNFEFTSTTNWTVTSDSSWILLNMSPTSGGPGFYHDNQVFIASVNTGHDRVGHIYIKSANDEDTVIVIQKGMLSSITTATVLSDELIEINVYPNPANNSVIIKVNEQTLPGVLSITDMQGRVIRTASMNQTELTVDLSDVSNGCYFVQYKNDKSSVTGKLIVVH